jgi:hypothetical protein
MKKIEIYDHGRILPFLFLFGHEKVSSSVLESRIGVHGDGGIVCIYRSLRGKKRDSVLLMPFKYAGA